MNVLADLAEQAILNAQRRGEFENLKAKLQHGGLLLEENEAYFHKVVSRVTLNRP